LAEPAWAAGDAYSALSTTFALAQAQLVLGRLGAARRTCEDACRRFERTRPAAARPNLGIAQIGLAQAALEMGEIEWALELARCGARLCEQLGYARWSSTGRAVLGRVLYAAGDVPAALAALDEAADAVKRPDILADVLNPVALYRARLQLADGDVGSVRAWLDRRGVSAEQRVEYAREGEHLLLSRVLLAEQQPRPALDLLQRLRRHAEAQARTGSALEIRVFECVALDRLGEAAAARTALAESLAAAEAEEPIRIFVEGGADLRSVLNRLNLSGAYVGRLRAAVQPRPATTRPESTAPPDVRRSAEVEPLSEREREVLGLLADGLSNREIADRLVIAPDTAKKHLSHILGKLGATNRTQAVARARQLGML
jgi:LuxR family maltose regulon positive regulatory protein